MKPSKIEDLPNNGIKVLLMRRTTNDTVKTCVGYRDAYGNIRGWHGSRPPTDWCQLPLYAKGAK